MNYISKVFRTNIFKFSTLLAFNHGLNFLLIFIYLKTISSATYGTIGLIQSYSILIGVISMLGIRDGFYTIYYKVNKNALYSNFYLFFIFMTSLLFFISMYFKEFFTHYLSIPLEFYNLIFIYAMSNALYANFEIVMRLENWNNLYLSISLIRGITVFLFKLYFVFHIENNIDFITNILLIDIFSFLIISMIIFIVVNIKILKFKFKIDFSLYPRLFKVGLPFLASNGSGWIFNGFDRVLIERFFSLEILGIYLYGTKIAAAVGNIIHQVLNLLYAPKALKLLSEGDIVSMELLGDKVSSWLIKLIFISLIFTVFIYFSLYYLNILNYRIISILFLGSILVEITKIIPRINGQKILFLEKSYILSSLYIFSSILIVIFYYTLLSFGGIGIIFLSQIFVYFLISYFIHLYIINKTIFNIVSISRYFWLIISIISFLLLIYFFNLKGLK